MAGLRYIGLLCIGLLPILSVAAQDMTYGYYRAAPVQQVDPLIAFLNDVEKKYGSDVDLVNGQKYFYPYGRANGDPFLPPGTMEVDLEIRGRTFPGQRIKYDIYNQQLVLEYMDVSGTKGNLVLRVDWVESFRTANALFRKMDGPGGSPGYFQEVYRGEVGCYYLWSCLYQLDMSGSSQQYMFTEPRHTAYLYQDGNFHEFRNNRTFLRFFGDEHRKQIKQFMRQGSLKVKRARDRDMASLMNYCNSLLHETN